MPDTNAPLLLVDDDPGDIFLLQRALQKANILLPQLVVSNGEEAIDCLSGRRAPEANGPLVPHSIFLDLKMPFINGFEVLEWKRSQPHLSSVQVFVLTGSSIERDRERALALGANAYLIKPAAPETLKQLLGAA